MIRSLPHFEPAYDPSNLYNDLHDCAHALSCEVKVLELQCTEVRNSIRLACTQLDNIIHDLLQLRDTVGESPPAIQKSVPMAKPEDTNVSVSKVYNLWHAKLAQ